MKFQLIVVGLFNFLHIRFCELQKASPGITPWKNATVTALALLITGCAQQTFTVQNKPAAVTQGNHHPSFLRFWNWAEETVDAAKICGGAEMLKNRTQQTFVNGLLGFITLGIYTPLEACVLLTILHELPIDIQLYLHCSLIYFWVPSSCFCIVISLLWGWNNPAQRCLRRGRFSLSTPEAVVVSRALIDRLFDANTTTSGSIITQSIIFSFSIS